MWSKRRLTGALTNTAGRNGPSDRRFGRWSKALAGYAAALGRRRGRRGGLASRLGSGARRDFIIIMTMMMMMMTMMMMIMIIMIIMITAAVTIIRLAAAGGLGERRAPASTRAVSRFPPGPDVSRVESKTSACRCPCRGRDLDTSQPQTGRGWFVSAGVDTGRCRDPGLDAAGFLPGRRFRFEGAHRLRPVCRHRCKARRRRGKAVSSRGASRRGSGGGC